MTPVYLAAVSANEPGLRALCAALGPARAPAAQNRFVTPGGGNLSTPLTAVAQGGSNVAMVRARRRPAHDPLRF